MVLGTSSGAGKSLLTKALRSKKYCPSLTLQLIAWSDKPPSAKTDVSSASGLASVVFSVRLHGMQREVNELFGSYEPILLLLQLAHPRMDFFFYG